MEPREKAAQLPESPGVYLFKDAGGTVLYVGKARNLRSRVRSYFLESRWIDTKTGSLAREIADLETIVVGNEREALALEHNLIKQYRPKFNVVLRDDKTYPTSSSLPRTNILACTSRAASRKTARFISGRIFPPAWRGAFCILFTSAFSFLPARSTSRAAIRGPACSITSSGVWGLASQD